MNIRRATPDDAETVGSIHVQSWNVAYRVIMPDEFIAQADLKYRTEFWASRIADPDWPVFILDDEGESVAFCQMIASPDPDADSTRIGHITSLHALPHSRGRGYGTALVNHVRREFKKRGFEELTLWVLEENQAARKFYEKYGFALDGGTRVYPRTNVPEVRYRIRV